MVEVKEQGFRQAEAALINVIRKVQNRGPLMAQLAEDMHDDVIENFEQEGRPKWKKLAASTIRGRRRRGHWPGKILQVKGLLIKSIQTKSSNDTAMVGTNDRRAKMLHFGGTTKHAARDRILHFGKVRPARMGKDRFGPGRPTRDFAKPGKANLGMKTQGKAYSVTTPGRPFMVLSSAGIARMLRHAMAYLKESVSTGFFDR